MDPGSRSAYLRFVREVLVLAILLAAIGWWPTDRWGGSAATTAMLAGLGITVLASLVGGIPIAIGFASSDPKSRVVLLQGSIASRFFVALVLIAGALISGWFARAPLAVWFVLGYLALLAPDIRFARRALASPLGSEKR